MSTPFNQWTLRVPDTLRHTRHIRVVTKPTCTWIIEYIHNQAHVSEYTGYGTLFVMLSS